MQKPPFRKKELNENVLIGLAFHKRQIWLHANVIVLFPLSVLRDQDEVGEIRKNHWLCAEKYLFHTLEKKGLRSDHPTNAAH